MIDRYRGYRPPANRPHTRRPSRPPIRKLLFIIGAVLIGFTGWRLLQREGPTPSAPAPAIEEVVEQEEEPIYAEAISTDKWNELSQALNAAIAGHPDFDISIAIIDIATKTKANYGLQDNFVGASTTKILSAAAYFEAVEHNQRSLGQLLGEAPARDHLKLMVNRSNNQSWEAINSNLGHRQLEAYAHNLGLSSYSAAQNVITASDEATLLQKLYTGELLSEANTKLLLSYMQRTNNEDMIPRVLPEGATIYHKYGQLDDRLHDAAILEHQDRPVVLVIYTKGGPEEGMSYGQRARLVRDLAQTALDIIYADQ